MYLQENRNLKNKGIYVRFAIIIVFSVLSLITLVVPFNHEITYVSILFSTWVVMIAFTLLNPAKRIFIMMYLISFFNFQIGRSVLIQFGGYEESHSFLLSDSLKGQKNILFSFLIFSIFILIFDYYYDKKDTIENDYSSFTFETLRKITKYLYYFFIIFYLINLGMKISFVNSHGYPGLFLNKTANIPTVIRKLSDIAPFMFYFFIGTMPSKKEIKIPLILHVLTLILTLQVGSRFAFVIGVITLFSYLVLRNNINPGSNIWVSRKTVVVVIASGILAIGGLSIYSETRFGFQFKETNPVKIFTKFFYDQGINVNNNKRIFKHENQIPENRIYSFNSMVSFYERNFEPLLTGERKQIGNNLERAYNGNSLSDMLSVLVLGEEKYLSGLGVGSSYIAEVYHDFSFTGLFIVNVIYAYIIVLIGRLVKNNTLFFVIGITIFTALLKVPRANADLPLLYFIDPMLWISSGIVYFSFKAYIKRNQYKMINRKGI